MKTCKTHDYIKGYRINNGVRPRQDHFTGIHIVSSGGEYWIVG